MNLWSSGMMDFGEGGLFPRVLWSLTGYDITGQSHWPLPVVALRLGMADKDEKKACDNVVPLHKEGPLRPKPDRCIWCSIGFDLDSEEIFERLPDGEIRRFASNPIGWNK